MTIGRPRSARPRHRRCVVLRGERADTAARARDYVDQLAPEHVLWVTAGDDPGAAGCVRPASVRKLLGRAFDAVVLDLHDRLDPDVLGQVHGMVWGGGALILRLPPRGELPGDVRGGLGAYPFGDDEAGTRFYRRFERVLAAYDAGVEGRLQAPHRDLTGTREQAEVVGHLATLMGAPTVRYAAVVADRGRGKSAAIGLAIAQATTGSALRVAVTAAREDAAREVFRFADAPGSPGAVAFVPITELLHAEPDGFDVIAVDEAAQLPIPWLTRLVTRHAATRVVFATTVHGYEGTGRGFMLRFLDRLRDKGAPVAVLRLRAPIRWDDDDPVERLIFEALLLDAEPAPVQRSADPTGARPEVVDRDALAQNEHDLRALFGLMTQAHYRTTPSDLRRLLDAPNITVHALRLDGDIVAATLVALEGGLTDDQCAELVRGRLKLRGHALPDTLVTHLGRHEAGRLRMVRSVRIAVHPALRRCGLGTRLIEHVHETYRPDLFGTLFGATAELVRFRRHVGYEAVRLSSSRGERTGEPAACMLRPVSAAGRALVADLRRELARELPLQIQLLEREALLHADVADVMAEDLPAAEALDPEERRDIVYAYAFGVRTYESVATAVTRFVEAHPAAVASLPPWARALIAARVVARTTWPDAARAAGMPHARAAMRGLRRALRLLLNTLETSPAHPSHSYHE